MGAERSMAIPLNNLGGEPVRLESEFFADCCFDLRIKVCVSSDCSAQFPDRNFRPCRTHSSLSTPELVVHQCHFQPERDWLGMDPMTSANHGSVLVFAGLPRDLFS